MMFGRIGLPELIALCVLAAIGALYFLPTIVAVRRQKTNLTAIAVVNVLLGWSVIGWIIAMVWAVSTQVVDAPASAGPATLCVHCGKYNLPTARFCAQCGHAAGG
jgi:hypothetical protein